jgi:poly-gamma-glutamate synthesis protein (capsule biosynthesis protein)
LHYVRLGEEANGPIPRQVGFSYVWGAALDELNRTPVDIRIVSKRALPAAPPSRRKASTIE